MSALTDDQQLRNRAESDCIEAIDAIAQAQKSVGRLQRDGLLSDEIFWEATGAFDGMTDVLAELVEEIGG